SASRRRALVLSSWGYLVGMGEVPLLFFVCFQCTGSELNPVHINLVGMGEVPLLFFVCFQCTGSELNPVHITHVFAVGGAVVWLVGVGCALTFE
ncbi:hypothetical protein, partial [Rothia nasimurium]|uniref:hypothetical protein n=1 Tax=Rothia nasimurium TaxID=85336 RepID=UPI001ADDAACE